MALPAPLNEYTATREEFSKNLLETPMPKNATNEWKRQVMDLQDTFRLLAYHPAMVDTGNLQQTFMTPALSKNKIYFMWDFVGRTLAMLYAIPPTVTIETGGEAFNDVIGRSVMAAELLLDSKPGLLDMMVQSAYPGASRSTPVIGDDLKAAARDMTHDG